MAEYSVVQAKNNLSELIDRAIAGEAVVVTRHGAPVVELKAVRQQGRPMTKADLEWLRENRVIPLVADDDPRSIVERMRDEDEERLFRR